MKETMVVSLLIGFLCLFALAAKPMVILALGYGAYRLSKTYMLYRQSA